MGTPKRKATDSINERFGYLVVDRIFWNEREAIAVCTCDCGTKNKEVRLSSLRGAMTKSCGCLMVEMARKSGLSRTTHGHSRRLQPTSKTYKAWSSMLERCHTETSSGYLRYGAKGVFVCDEWRKSFQTFLKDMGDAPTGMTLDRIDWSKGYSKENCRWATKLQQARNTSRNIMIEIDGQTKCLSEWAEFYGTNYDKAKARYYRGCTGLEIFG